MQLDRELGVFEAHRADLIAAGHEGRWALVHDTGVVGTFDTKSAAFDEGFDRFGTGFLVKEILREDRVYRMSSLLRPPA